MTVKTGFCFGYKPNWFFSCFVVSCTFSFIFSSPCYYYYFGYFGQFQCSWKYNNTNNNNKYNNNSMSKCTDVLWWTLFSGLSERVKGQETFGLHHEPVKLKANSSQTNYTFQNKSHCGYNNEWFCVIMYPCSLYINLHDRKLEPWDFLVPAGSGRGGGTTSES